MCLNSYSFIIEQAICQLKFFTNYISEISEMFCRYLKTAKCANLQITLFSIYTKYKYQETTTEQYGGKDWKASKA